MLVLHYIFLNFKIDNTLIVTYSRRKKSKMNKKKDKWDICRTCGNAGDIDVFGRDGVALQLEEKINTYLPITVSTKLF